MFTTDLHDIHSNTVDNTCVTQDITINLTHLQQILLLDK